MRKINTSKISVLTMAALLLLMPFTMHAQRITDFRFRRIATGLDYSFPGEIDHDTRTITVRSERNRTQGWIENITQLSATFEFEGSEITVNDIPQISEVTTNDYRKPVVYTIDGSVQYTVILEHPQASELPVIKIDTENGAPILDRENYVNMSFSLADPNNQANDVIKTDMCDLIRGRGHSSWSGSFEDGGKEWMPDKKPYRIKFDKKTSLMGLPAAKSWVLLANWYDPTLLKNTFAFELANRLEIPFNHSYNHVELYLNGTYQGSYLLTEHNQVGEGRVDIDENEGWFVQMDFHYGEEPKFRTVHYDIPVIIKSPEVEPLDMSNPAYNFVRDDINRLCDLMAAVDFPENGYRDLIDMETLVKYFLVAVVTGIGDFDGPGSVYFYKDKGGKISGGPPWDFDINFGFNWTNDPVYIVNAANARYPADKVPFPQNPFFRRFFDDPVFVKKWKECWELYYDEIASMPLFIDSMADIIRKSANENYKVSWLDYPVDFDHWLEELKTFVNNRVDYLNEARFEATAYPSHVYFSSAIVGYSEITPQTVMLTGNIEAQDVWVALEGVNDSSFERSANPIHLVKNENGEYSASVNVKPINSLPEGKYSADMVFYGFFNDPSIEDHVVIPLSFEVREASNDATLSRLSTNSGILSPVFNPNIKNYTISVVSQTISISCAANHTGAKVDNVSDFPLEPGENIITILVTAEDGTTTETYTLTVFRAEPVIASVAVFPDAVTLQKGDKQQFAANITYTDEYAIYENLLLNEVSGNHKFVEIYNAGSEDISLEGVKLQRNDGPIAGGSEWLGTAGDMIPAGAYRIFLFRDYTPADLATNQAFTGWTLTSGISDQQILKVALVAPSGNELSVFIRGDAPLPAWQSTDGVARNRIHSYSRMNDGSWGYAVPTPGVENEKKESDIINPGYLTEKHVLWQLSGAMSTSTTINADGLLTVANDETASSLNVTATLWADSDKFATATVTVIGAQLSSDATLKRLNLSNGVISPAFNANVMQYTVNVENFVTDITIKGEANHSAATVTGNVSNHQLNVGISTFIITVTAEDGVTVETYTITVIRAQATAVNEIFASNLIIYPNPFTDEVHITCATTGLTMGHAPLLKIINAAGTVVLTQKITNPNETISLAHLPAGIYFFRFEKDNNIKTVIVVKN